jgi:hypothetical protein
MYVAHPNAAQTQAQGTPLSSGVNSASDMTLRSGPANAVNSGPSTSVVVAAISAQMEQPLQYINESPQTLAMPNDPLFYTGTGVTNTDVKRGCAIYYSANTDICDNYDHWYNLPTESLKQKSTDSSLKAEDQRAAQTIRDEVANLRDKGGVCKLNFERGMNWKEPKVTVDGRHPISLKNTTSSSILQQGDPLNWAYCFKSLDGGARNNVLSGLVDGKAIRAVDSVASPFQNDIAPYAQVAFSKLTLTNDLKNAFCNASKMQPNNVPSTIFKFSLTLGDSPLISDFAYTKFNTSTLRFDPINVDDTFFSRLYKIKLDPTAMKLELVPQGMSCQVYIMYWDICGRLDKFDTIPLSASLKDLGLIAPITLSTFSSTHDLLYGEYQTIKDGITNRQSALANESKRLTQLEHDPNYKPGMMLTEFTSTAIPTQNGAYVINSDVDFNNALVIPSAQQKSMNLISDIGIQQNGNSVSTATGNQRIWTWEGFLCPKKGRTYYFSINCDDAGDVFVNGQRVAYYYSNHTPLGLGRSAPGIRLEAGRYYAFKARLFNSGGSGLINVTWDYNAATGDELNFVPIPRDVLFYNDNILQAATSRATIQTLNSDLTTLQNYVAMIDAKVLVEANKTIPRLKNQPFMQKIYSAKYLSGNEAQVAGNHVYINFMNIDTSYVEPRDPNTSPQGTLIIERFVDIQNTNLVKDIPTYIDIRSTDVVYTCIMKVLIQKTVNDWRNIIHLQQDMVNDDRTPAVFIFPGSTRLHIRHASTRNQNDGVDTITAPTLNKYFVLAIVVNKNRIDLYINGKLDATSTLPYNQFFVWNYNNRFDLSKKKLVYNSYNRMRAGREDGRVDLKMLEWAHEAFDATNVQSVTTRMLTS